MTRITGTAGIMIRSTMIPGDGHFLSAGDGDILTTAMAIQDMDGATTLLIIQGTILLIIRDTILPFMLTLMIINMDKKEMEVPMFREMISEVVMEQLQPDLLHAIKAV